MLEALGIDVECPVVTRSIDEVGLGLFNGMSQGGVGFSFLAVGLSLALGAVLGAAVRSLRPG